MISSVSLPPVGGRGGIGGSCCFFHPAPILGARANNDDNKDSCIIVKETQEKTNLLHLMLRWSIPLYKARAGA